MERFRKIFAFKTQRKVFALIFLVLVFLFILASLFFSYYSQKRIEKNTINFMSLINYQIDVQINNIFKSINRVLFVGTLYPDFIEVLSAYRDLDKIEDYERALKINEFIRLSNWVNPYILTLTFVDNEGTIFNVMGGTDRQLEHINENIDRLDKSGKNILLTPIDKNTWFNLVERNGFSVFGILNDTNSREKFGYACIDIDFKDFIEKILSKQTEYQGNYFLIYENARLIYSDGNNEFGYSQITSGKDISGQLQSSLGKRSFQNVFRSSIDNEEYLVVMHTNERTGWVLAQYQNIRKIKSSNRAVSFLYFAIIIPLLLISIFFLYILNQSTFKSVRKLVAGMEKVEKGEIVPIENPEKGDYEIGQLIDSFNNMANNLRESIYRQYILKTEQKRTELKILQSQINPHFLANTLNLIQSIARAEKNEIIPKISQNLIKMFRYSIDGRTEVFVREEIEHIKKYIEIQDLRFPGRCTVEYEINQDVLNLKMIKFILQPLVENSYYHGIERTSREGRILVRIVEIENDEICISVIDNGVGIEAGKLSKIKEELEVQRDKLVYLDDHEGLGIKNVCFRIKDYYGEKYGLEIFSTHGTGTTIKVIIPKQTF
jgi:two-component system, sensor histidine kinase YesM